MPTIPIPPNIKRNLAIDFGFNKNARFVITGKLKSTGLSREEAIGFVNNCGANAISTATVGKTKDRSILVVGQDTTSITKIKMAIANDWEIWTEGDFLKLMYMHQLYSESFTPPDVRTLAEVYKAYDKACFNHTATGNSTVNAGALSLILKHRIDILSQSNLTPRDPTEILTSILQRANFYVSGYQMDNIELATKYPNLSKGLVITGRVNDDYEDDLGYNIFNKTPTRSKTEILQENISSNENYGLF